MENCIFCKIASGEIPSTKVWEDEKFYAFLDINPMSPGHTLVIPRQHIDNIFDLDESLYNGLWRAAKMLSSPLRKATGAKRIGVAVEGFLVKHAHVHLVPLHNGGELDFKRAKSASHSELSEMGRKIRDQF